MTQMKVLILAGGLGTRISEESHLRPKPMIEIAGRPILWHIMKYYSTFGHNDFIICCGYMQYVIKEFFADYYLHMSDVTFDFSAENRLQIHNNAAEPWRVTLIDTGLDTMTGGRIKRARKYIGNEPFLMTYGDGVSDVNIDDLIAFHKKNAKQCTLTAIQPTPRFGNLTIDTENAICNYQEKKKSDGGWANGGFMVIEPEVIDLIEDDHTAFEGEPLEKLIATNQLQAFKHHGFWQCMDTLRDKIVLEDLIKSGKAPWLIWEAK